MVWYVNVPWAYVLIGVVTLIIGAVQFWLHLDVYEHIYSPSRALSQAAIKAF